MDFAAAEFAEVVSGSKGSKIAAESVERQTLRKQLVSGSKRKRVIPANSTKQSARSRGDIFTNISR